MQLIQTEDLDPVYDTSRSMNGYESGFSSWKNDVRQRWSYDLNAFIGHEMKLVPEVESVFISKEDGEGKVLRITVVINARDPDVRAAIYKREQAIMDELRAVDFDFHIIAREGRPLEGLITDAGAGENAF